MIYILCSITKAEPEEGGSSLMQLDKENSKIIRIFRDFQKLMKITNSKFDRFVYYFL